MPATPSQPHPARAASHALDAASSPPLRVVVASDGSESSRPALSFARVLAGRGASVGVVAVVEPPPSTHAPVEVALYWPEHEVLRRRQLLERVREQALPVLGEDAASAVEVRTGATPEEVAAAVRARHADMVITGRRHHGRLERLLASGDTPLAIARASHAPVLVVPEEAQRLPRTALVAMDFDDASINAAHVARPLLAAVEQVYVVHVREVAAPPEELRTVGLERYYTELMRTTSEQMLSALELPVPASVDTRTLIGHPVEQLLDFAEFAGVDLIITGHRQRPLLDRLTTRSVAERVFRGAKCAVLLVPEHVSRASRRATDETVSPNAWRARLATFEAANLGRFTRLDIDDGDAAVQAQAHGYVLRAIGFEREGGGLRIKLGGAAEDAPWLVHGIPRPTALEFHRARRGGDLALRIVHEGGSTSVSFTERAAPTAE